MGVDILFEQLEVACDALSGFDVVRVQGKEALHEDSRVLRQIKIPFVFKAGGGDLEQVIREQSKTRLERGMEARQEVNLDCQGSGDVYLG